MTTISQALTSLGIDEWVLRGDPQDEAEFKAMFRKITGKDKNDSAIESSDEKDWGVTWKQVNDEKTKLINEEPMRLLREQRNNLLKQTDFYALSDVTMTDKMKTYRQELRDMPKTAKPKLDKNGGLDQTSVKIPTKPS